jgi:hypothetical protein
MFQSLPHGPAEDFRFFRGIFAGLTIEVAFAVLIGVAVFLLG